MQLVQKRFEEKENKNNQLLKNVLQVGITTLKIR